MSFHKWAMRHASMILFVTAAAIFFISIAHALLSLNNGAETSFGSEVISAKLASVFLFLSSIFAALSSAAIPFVGAVAIDRWDRRNLREAIAE